MAATTFSPRAGVVINDRITALCKQALFSQALQSFDSVRPDTPLLPSTYSHLAAACTAVNSLPHGQAVHRHLLNSGVAADVVLSNHIVTMYGKCGSVGDARKVFDEMRDRNSVSWSAMIAGYTNNRCEMDAIELFADMLLLGFRPDGFALANVIRSCGGLEDEELGEQLHCYVVKCGLGFELVVKNAMISMYTRFDRLSDVVEVFEETDGRDFVSWSSLIAAYSRFGCEWDSLCLFKEMMGCNVHCPNEFVFGSVFRACGGISNLDCGRQLHEVCLKLGFRGDCFLGCSLCDMYLKCGSIESAKVAFCEIESPDLACWNVIITGLSSCNDACGAIFFFQ